MERSRLAPLSVAALCTIGCAIATIGLLLPEKSEVLRIGYGIFPPFMMRDANGSPGGFAVDVVSEAARRRGIGLEWVEVRNGPDAPFADRTIDLYPLFAHTPTPRRGIYYSQPWWENSLALVVDKKRNFHGPADFSGRRIALVEGSITASLAPKFFPQSI